MSINLYKKKTINNQPVLEELLSKSTDTVDNKPLVYDSTTDNVKSVDDLTVNSVTASCFHGPLDGTAKNATCFNEKTYAEACADILSGCAADSNKLNGKTYSEVCADILSGTAANATCFAGKTCTEWKDIIKTTCVDNAALATNATCFNGCTYAEACADIRNGLATQTCVDAVQACADAVQNCADFIQSCVSAIESKIPSQASASNQLADKAFVNSSITTNTANFRGTYSCVADLPSTGNTNNDYAFVCSLNTTTGNYIYDRYKWVASDSCWVCEYELNTTGFTAEQLASINSGITSNLVAKITDVYDNTVTVCMNGECKGSFSLNQNTDSTIDLGSSIRYAYCANYATNAAQASAATNATCFNGCTYSEAKEDFRNGMAAAVSIGNSCPYQADGNRVVHIPAYPPDLSSCAGINCVGTVTQVKVGTTAYDPVSGIVSLPEYPTIPTTVCTAECANTVKRNTANSGSCYLALFNGNTAVSNASLYVSNSKAITYTPATGCLSTCYVRGISGLIAGNPIGCTSSVLGQSGTNISSGTLNLYACTPSIGFHVNDSASTSQSLIACCGRLIVCVNNRTGCTESTDSANFVFCSNGILVATCFDGTATCATCVARCTASTGICYLALFSANTVSIGTNLYVSNACPITYRPATGVLTATCFDGNATNSTCFGGCTYAQACTNIRSGLISDIGVKVYCDTTCKCTLAKDSSLCLSANAFNANATISTTTYPGACCTGTSNYVVTTMVCCAKSVCRNQATTGTCHLALFGDKTAIANANMYVSATCPLTYNPSTGVLTAACFDGAISMNCVANATNVTVAANSITRKTILRNQIANVGFVTSVAIGLCRGTSGFGQALISVSCNDAGSVWKDYCFNNTGTISANGLTLRNDGDVNTGVYMKVGTASRNANRNIMFTPAVPGSDATSTAEVQVSSCCPLTFNPVTGVLTAKCFCGCVTASGQIDCAKAIKRYQATSGNCHIALFNGTTAIDDACAYVSSCCPLTYNPATGELSTKGGAVFGGDVFGYCNGTISDTCRTWSIADNGLAKFRFAYICGPLSLGAQCDICIRDYCNNDFICGRCNNLTIGYNSCDFEENFNCSRITVGLNNYMYKGTVCGCSVVVGMRNCVCWQNEDYMGFIYGFYNTTSNGGLAVGGWNRANGECSVALGWDERAACCSVAIGIVSCACCPQSVAIGCDTGSLGDYSISIGSDSRAYCSAAITIGAYAQNEVACGLVIGYGSNTDAYGTACVNSNIRKGPLREITVTWCDDTLRCDIWKAIACNIDLRKNGKGTIISSGCTYLSATGYISNNDIPLYACNYNYNSSLATMCSILVRASNGFDIIALSATCTTTASGGGSGGGFLTITGWSR